MLLGNNRRLLHKGRTLISTNQVGQPWNQKACGGIGDRVQRWKNAAEWEDRPVFCAVSGFRLGTMGSIDTRFRSHIVSYTEFRARLF